MQQGPIKIGGSGGGSKSRSRCVFGCANGAGVGEIALVIFYYSTSSEVGRLAAATGRRLKLFMKIRDFFYENPCSGQGLGHAMAPEVVRNGGGNGKSSMGTLGKSQKCHEKSTKLNTFDENNDFHLLNTF